MGKTISLSGKCRRQVYIYYGKPLKRIADKKTFWLTASIKPVTMKSELTGRVWNAGKHSDYSLWYKGKPVGASSADSDVIRDMLSHGYDVRILAGKFGMYEGPIPNIKLLMPERNKLRSSWMKGKEPSKKPVAPSPKKPQSNASSKPAPSRQRKKEMPPPPPNQFPPPVPLPPPDQPPPPNPWQRIF